MLFSVNVFIWALVSIAGVAWNMPVAALAQTANEFDSYGAFKPAD